MEQAKAEDLVRRIATAVRGADLYSPTHPLVQRGIDNLVASTQEALQRGTVSIAGYAGLIRKVAFPHELIVYASVAATL